MLGIDQELDQLYEEAQKNGEAVIKSRRIAKNYGCCSTNSPIIEKYRIKKSKNETSLFIWGKLAVKINFETRKVIIDKEAATSSYEEKVIDWFVEKMK
ncbi:hypothetical protein [Enterococcus alishanensis]